jgi:hypothetical protein
LEWESESVLVMARVKVWAPEKQPEREKVWARERLVGLESVNQFVQLKRKILQQSKVDRLSLKLSL